MIRGSNGERTAAMRSTSNRLLRIKQASASSILQAVSRACDHRSERQGEPGKRLREKTWERACCHVIEGEDKRETSRTIEQQTNQCVFQAHTIYG